MGELCKVSLCVCVEGMGWSRDGVGMGYMGGGIVYILGQGG